MNGSRVMVKSRFSRWLPAAILYFEIQSMSLDDLDNGVGVGREPPKSAQLNRIFIR